MLTLARAARAVGGTIVGDDVIEHGLSAYGERGDEPLQNETREARAMIVSQFVRRLRVSVQKTHDLERALLVELHAAPEGVQVVAIKDAISVIKARNHVSQIAKTIGLSWADGMRLESVVSDFVRYAGANGGGLLCTRVVGERAQIEIKLKLNAGGPDLGLLGSLEPGALVTTRREGNELGIELVVARSARSGAA